MPSLVDGGVYGSVGSLGLPAPQQYFGPPPPTGGSAVSAPPQLQPVRGAPSKPRKPSVRTTPSTQNVFIAPNDGGLPTSTDAAHAFAAQERERQQQHLQQIQMRQEQQLRRLGAGGPSYDRLQQQGMPLP